MPMVEQSVAASNRFCTSNHPATASPMLASILVLDLGKFKSVACVLDPTASTHRYDTIATNPASVHDLLAEIKPRRLVIEACGIAGQSWCSGCMIWPARWTLESVISDSGLTLTRRKA